MADSTTTGSALTGCIPGGLQKGCLSSAGANTVTSKILFVYGSPADVVTASTGSQLAIDIENNDVYMAVAQNGSGWARLGSLT